MKRTPIYRRNQQTALILVLKWGLLLYGLFILYITTVPFEFDLTLRGITLQWLKAEKIPLVHGIHDRLSGTDLLGNLILFLPLGFFVFAGLIEKGAASARALFFSTLTGFSYSIALAAFHLFLPRRFTSANDLLMNTLGAAVGGGLGWASYRYLRPYLLGLIEHARNHPMWLFWSVLALLQVFVVMSPFNISIKVMHLERNLRRLWESRHLFPLLNGVALERVQLETLLMGFLLASVFFLALKFQRPVRGVARRALTFGLLSYYPALTVLSLIRRGEPMGLPSLVFGEMGILVALLFFGRIPDPQQARAGTFRYIRWNRRGVGFAYLALFLTHFFFPFRFTSYEVWARISDSASWIALPAMKEIFSNGFLLDKTLILLLLAPLGYLFSRRSLALAIGDRLVRVFAIGLVLGIVVEGLQFGIPQQTAELAALPFYPLGAVLGVYLESWWRRTQIQITRKTPLSHFLAVFRPGNMLTAEP